MSKLFYKALGATTTWPDLPGNIPPTSITYADVNLLPQDTNVMSRSSVDTSVQLGPYKLTIPFVAAPMDTVSGEKMIRGLHRLGALGTLPRATEASFEDNVKLCKQLATDGVACMYAIGLKHGLEEAAKLFHAGAEMIVIDVAHGGMQQVKDLAKEIKKKFKKLTIVAGNIANYSQALAYKNSAIDIAKVGIGPGSVCITRLVAGTGFPQLSAVFETTSVDIPIIADGGIKYPGDFAKAMAAGATCIMGGSMLAGTVETPGEVINGEKVYRGQASASYMKDHGSQVNEKRSAEGITTTVPAKGPVATVMNDFLGGLRSAMSYAGATTIKEFQEKAVFNLSSSSVQIENRPHITIQ